jgi:hypothetical protein
MQGWLVKQILIFGRLRKWPGQVLALAPLLVLFFVLIAAGLIDVYHLEEARNWGYAVAQNAAMAGVSSGRDWTRFEATQDPALPAPTPRQDKCVDPGLIQLNEGTARDQAFEYLKAELKLRTMDIYDPKIMYRIEVLKDPGGGSIPGFPVQPVRLGAGQGYWQTKNPAVGVYLSFPVRTFFMSIVGRSSVTINVFGSAQVAQPLFCPTLTPTPPI